MTSRCIRSAPKSCDHWRYDTGATSGLNHGLTAAKLTAQDADEAGWADLTPNLPCMATWLPDLGKTEHHSLCMAQNDADAVRISSAIFQLRGTPTRTTASTVRMTQGLSSTLCDLYGRPSPTFGGSYPGAWLCHVECSSTGC